MRLKDILKEDILNEQTLKFNKAYALSLSDFRLFLLDLADQWKEEAKKYSKKDRKNLKVIKEWLKDKINSLFDKIKKSEGIEIMIIHDGNNFNEIYSGGTFVSLVNRLNGWGYFTEE